MYLLRGPHETLEVHHTGLWLDCRRMSRDVAGNIGVGNTNSSEYGLLLGSQHLTKSPLSFHQAYHLFVMESREGRLLGPQINCTFPISAAQRGVAYFSSTKTPYCTLDTLSFGASGLAAVNTMLNLHLDRCHHLLCLACPYLNSFIMVQGQLQAIQD